MKRRAAKIILMLSGASARAGEGLDADDETLYGAGRYLMAALYGSMAAGGRLAALADGWVPR